MFKLKMFLFAISIFVVFSCNKEKKPVWVPENLQEFGLNEPSQDLLAYITKEQGLDEEDIHINRQLLTLSMALKGVIFNESVSRNIILSAKETASNTVSVKEMLESNQIVNDVSIRFQNYANDYKKMNPAYRRASFTDVLSHIKYGKYEYLITIFVLNSDYLNPDLMPIFTSGLEINPNDDILGWKSNGAEIILSEENTKSIKNPIFIINLHPLILMKLLLGR